MMQILHAPTGLAPALRLPLWLALMTLALVQPARAHTIAMPGISFSDELGGFDLVQVKGKGSIADPFVVVERVSNPDGATLVFRADASLGNLIGSPDRIGFALVKVMVNASGHDWSSMEVELQSKYGQPSDHTDELSYGQGSDAGRPFTSTVFRKVTLIDEPYDRIEFEDGIVPPGGSVILRFVVSQPESLKKAYIVQRPGRPVASRPGPAPSLAAFRLNRFNQRPEVTFERPPAAD